MKNKNIGKGGGLNGLRPSTVSSVVAIAISGNKKSKYVMKWAFQNLIPEGNPGKVCFKLLHVFPQITSVPLPFGGGIPISQVRNDVATAYRNAVESKTSEKLLPYKIACHRNKVQVEVVQIESDDIANVIAEQIGKYNINKLVIGASSTSRMFSRRQNVSARVSECCPSFCSVFVVSKGNLSSVRPSDPETTTRTVEKTSDSNRFSGYTPNHSLISLPEWLAQRSTTSLPLPPPSPPAKEFRSLPVAMINRRRTSSDRNLSYNSTGEGEIDGNSSFGESDIYDAKSEASSSKSLTSDNHSWTTKKSSSVNASTDSSWGSQVDFNYELEQLRMELRHITGMCTRTQTEAIDASQKINDLGQQQQLEEMIKLQEISIKEEEAKELAEQEKAWYEATKKEAEYAKGFAEKEESLKTAADKKFIRDAKAKEKFESSLAGPVHYQEFSWEEIMSGTSSFSDDSEVGMGSYGAVYKCTLRHSTAVVKVLHSMEANRTKQFQQELEMLSKIHHPNLMTLLGACTDHGCLVYEYMENGSLEDILFRKNDSPPIQWFDRFRIACEIASALTFLHNTKPKPIIHRDLKPTNILLDQNLVSKIGDVGLSTLLHSDTLYKDTSPVGTLCYIDPEYQRTGLVSPKSDVYAFGMVVLQLLSAKRALGLTRTMEMAIENDRLAGLLDPQAGEWPVEATKELAILALRCTELHHRDRPDLKIQILPALEKLRMVADKARDLAFSGSTNLPNHFLCPMLKIVMNDPCVAADGYTYDRKAIEEWLEKYDTSPVTNLPMFDKSLIPNYALFSAITEWKSGNF